MSCRVVSPCVGHLRSYTPRGCCASRSATFAVDRVRARAIPLQINLLYVRLLIRFDRSRVLCTKFCATELRRVAPLVVVVVFVPSSVLVASPFSRVGSLEFFHYRLFRGPPCRTGAYSTRARVFQVHVEATAEVPIVSGDRDSRYSLYILGPHSAVPYDRTTIVFSSGSVLFLPLSRRFSRYSPLPSHQSTRHRSSAHSHSFDLSLISILLRVSAWRRFKSVGYFRNWR